MEGRLVRAVRDEAGARTGSRERFVALFRERGIATETGEFGAMMDVELVNDGPVTLWLER